ncbi:MAG: hypothetical protein UT42_C0042G0007 [Candidatus Falkowbacteria bacterium GW2011_GWA2_39_24]|uniref:Uncharacterized protein n=1 Tax=Candidatus Falkowbacteria bacterium GW2011_GWA2_39_24 TaxID=1618634 RepID=A0A0G0RJ71_9BACT|nr:MAG: hypothetical protein UT42_C0042G0007 [Candidatus Falkowbacteria bacterium GW2011_GWA2_39_24]
MLKEVMERLLQAEKAKTPIKVTVDHGQKGEADTGFIIPNSHWGEESVTGNQYILNVPSKTKHWVWLPPEDIKSIICTETGEILFAKES